MVRRGIWPRKICSTNSFLRYLSIHSDAWEYGESRAGNRRRREGVMLLSLDHKDRCRITEEVVIVSSKEFVE